MKNGLTWVLGEPNPTVDSLGRLPTLVNTTIKAEYGIDLVNWTAAVASADIITVTNGVETGVK